MAKRPSESMRIRLTDARRGEVLDALRELHARSFDEELSDYRAEAILDFFVRALGPPIYNQAIQDACAFMRVRVEDLDAEFYEPEQSSVENG